MSRIIAVGLSTTLQKTIAFTDLRKDCVNRSTGYRIDASGKAVNTARVLSQLESGIVINVCPLGEENAQVFLDLAKQDGVPYDWLPVPGRVRYCYSLLEPGTGLVTELVVGEPVGNADFGEVSEKLLSMIELQLADAEALVVAGSRPLAYPEDLYARIGKLGKDAGCIVMVDFHGKDLKRTLEVSIPDIIKINEEEFCGTFGYVYPLSEETLFVHLAAKSIEFDNTIVITRGSKDTFAATKGETFRHPVTEVVALNTIGCGDSFSAGFLYSWITGHDTRAALEMGNSCSLANLMNYRPGSIRNPLDKSELLW